MYKIQRRMRYNRVPRRRALYEAQQKVDLATITREQLEAVLGSYAVGSQLDALADQTIFYKTDGSGGGKSRNTSSSSSDTYWRVYSSVTGKPLNKDRLTDKDVADAIFDIMDNIASQNNMNIEDTDDASRVAARQYALKQAKISFDYCSTDPNEVSKGYTLNIQDMQKFSYAKNCGSGASRLRIGDNWFIKVDKNAWIFAPGGMDANAGNCTNIAMHLNNQMSKDDYYTSEILMQKYKEHPSYVDASNCYL